MEHPAFWQQTREFLMTYGHLPILGGLGWIGYKLHRHGVKMTFDIRIWKNGKEKDKH